MTITKIPSAGLEDSGVVAGTRGSSSEIPIVTVNSKGQVTQIGGAALDLSWTGISGRPTALSQFTNNLGNYGGFLDSLSVSYSGNRRTTTLGRSGNQLQFWSDCNCVCC